ncbi:MAG: HAD family hydrolase [Tannerellaceae bacterium]|jgi:putative hydrolase of the HAD superfamily|nr:HAD family hydrolase [Tannerellaceae bacterium]
MINTEQTKTLILDYGGTIDTNGVHWAAVIRMAYEALNIELDEQNFRDAYVHGERCLATQRLVEPNHNFWHVLRLKAEAQTSLLVERNLLPPEQISIANKIADWCYAYAQMGVNAARPVIKQLADTLPIALVTNFYGNIATVLEDFHLKSFFPLIVESATAGVRKPDPAIFSLAIKLAGCRPEEVCVVGDSYEKDIAPAHSIGCQTIWLRKQGWTEPSSTATASLIISDFSELANIWA